MFPTHEVFGLVGLLDLRASESTNVCKLLKEPDLRFASQFGCAVAGDLWRVHCVWNPQVRKEDSVMSGSARSTSQSGIIGCCICAKPVLLETSKTDERGKAVHEECYVRQTISRFRMASAVQAPEGLAQFDPRAVPTQIVAGRYFQRLNGMVGVRFRLRPVVG